MSKNININRNNFDFIRLTLAFTVMGHHICDLIPGDLYKEIHPLFKDQIAIRTFFIISGFLIAKSLANTSNLKKYFIKRIRRIVPAYTFVILFFALLLSFFSTLSYNEYFSSSQFWSYLGANLIYQNYLQPCLPGVFDTTNVNCAVNGALWTIKIEEAFYLLLPFLAFIQYKFFQKKWIFYFLVYIGSILFFNVLIQFGLYRFAKQLPGSLCFFVGGILAYHYFNQLIPKLKYLVIPAILLFLLELNFTSFLLISPFALTIITIYIAYCFKFLNRFGRYGDFTYGTYIFHYPIIQLTVWTGLHYQIGKWQLFSLIIVVTLLCAILSWKLIESRFISRNFINRIQSLETK